MKEDLLFDLLKEKADYNKLQFYIIQDQSKIKISVNEIIEQINLKINEITALILRVS